MENRYEHFSSSVSGIYRCVQKIEADEMIKRGLRGSYAQYLAALGGSGGMTLSQLSELCIKDKAAVSRAISEMEEKGLVVRKSDSDNMYRAAIVLTAEGRSVAEYVEEKAKIAVELAGRGLSDEDRKLFYAALDLISSNLVEICKNGLPE